MRLEIEDDGINIRPENVQDEVYLAAVLGLEKGGDLAKAMLCVDTIGPGFRPDPGFDYLRIEREDDG